VIEQRAHVACGREHFQDQELRFYETIEECLQHHHPQVLLSSAALQYLPSPYATLERLLAFGLPHLVIDRTPFLERNRDRLTVQTVPEWIYPARCPAWFFSEARFTSAIAAAGYQLVSDFAGADRASPEDDTAYFKGFIYEHREG
jgi:putative methyltransferase (TIGR04325 family)